MILLLLLVALALVVDRDLLEDRARLLGQRLPGVEVDEDAEVGLEEAGVDPVLEELVPGQVHHADRGPAEAVDRAALERGVDLGHVDRDVGRAEGVGEELAIDRVAAQLDAGEIGQAVGFERGLAGQVDVELDAAVGVTEVPGVELVLVDLVEQVDAAVRALLHRRDVGADQRVGLGHEPAVEAARAVDHVDHAGAQRLGLIERRDRLGAADELDLHDALARRVQAVDELEEALGVGDGLGQHRERAQHVFGLRAGRCQRQERRAGRTRDGKFLRQHSAASRFRGRHVIQAPVLV